MPIGLENKARLQLGANMAHPRKPAALRQARASDIAFLGVPRVSIVVPFLG